MRINNMLPKIITDKIAQLYGREKTPAIADKLHALVARYQGKQRREIPDFLTEKDIFLITYADSLRQPGIPPLQSLVQFTRDQLKELIGIVHILPFFPYSSDDGFSVIDYRQVNPDFGDWADIAALAEHVDICYDLVINHCSQSSRYFQGFLKGDPEYQDYFIAVDPDADTSSVLRPRTLPLLHEFDAVDGPKWVWTTFSRDQVDLNFSNPNVLIEMLDVLLFYVERGARVVRLDAIAYLWKELGASCAHLAQTHTVVKLLRDILDIVAPYILLLSETNVPHAQNISYFGDGWDEAQIVYNFPLPPLVLYALTAGDAAHLTRWAQTLKPVSERTTFLNFTASHDGIGVRPAADILTADEFQLLIDRATRHGGNVSSKNDQHGNPIPYELNINYFDALNNPNVAADPEIEIDRFLVSQSIPLVLMGIPAIYIHSLLGSRGWPEGVKQTGHPRTINREKLDLDDILRQLHQKETGLTPFSSRAGVFHRYAEMIKIRRRQKAFHPHAGQRVLDLGEAFFAVSRTSVDQTETILAIHNVTGEPQTCNFETPLLGLDKNSPVEDLISGLVITPAADGSVQVKLPPYRFMWIKFDLRT